MRTDPDSDVPRPNRGAEAARQWLGRWRQLRATRDPRPRLPGQIGRRAERRAERLLRRNGLRVLDRNYARRSGEIDLVMLHDDSVVFVEVRYRSGRFVSGLDSVDAEKRRRLIRTAELYLAEHPEHRYRGTRFDVVSASKGNYGIACEWIQDAFDAMES